MKNIIIIIIIIYTLPICSQEFQGIVKYGKKSTKIVYSDSSLKKMKNNSRMKQNFERMEQVIADTEKKFVFELKFKNNESFFKLKPFLNPDKNHKKSYIYPDDSSVYFDNNDESLKQMNVFGELFLITKPKLIWNIFKETKKIYGYKCLKATTKIIINDNGEEQLVTAWFSPEIPVSFGPLGYSGLPGLILEIEVYRSTYYATKIILNSKEEVNIRKPNKGIKVTEKELHKIASSTMQKFKKNQGY